MKIQEQQAHPFMQFVSWLDRTVRWRFLVALLITTVLFGFTNPTGPARHTLVSMDIGGSNTCIVQVLNGGAGIQQSCDAVTGLNYIFNTGTVASGTGITSTVGHVRPFTHRVTVAPSALTAAGTSDVTLVTTAANTRIIRVLARVETTFTGGGLTAVAVTCGNSAGGNQYLLSFSAFTAAGTFGDVVAEVGAGLLTATWADFGAAASNGTAAITVQCRFTCTTANCNAATQGNLIFYVEGVAYPQA